MADDLTQRPVSGSSSTESGAQAVKSYNLTYSDGSSNHKVLILLTNGENHWGGQSGDTASNMAVYGADPNNSASTPFGFFSQSRLGTTTASSVYALMNTKTKEACTNAKAAGVLIYTVGFTASDGISCAGQDLLTACSSGDGYNFIAADGSELVSVFQKIATQLSKLRLTQ